MGQKGDEAFIALDIVQAFLVGNAPINDLPARKRELRETTERKISDVASCKILPGPFANLGDGEGKLGAYGLSFIVGARTLLRACWPIEA